MMIDGFSRCVERVSFLDIIIMHQRIAMLSISLTTDLTLVASYLLIMILSILSSWYERNMLYLLLSQMHTH